MAKKWAKFPHADKAYVHDAAGAEEALGAAAQGRLRAAAQGRRGARGVAPLSTPAISAGGRGGPRRRRRRHQCRGQGAGVYANYLEKSDKAKLALFEEAAGWADARRAEAPKDANAHYLYAFALGRYSQGISVAKALAQGFGGKIKEALLTALKLEPKHADAHTAYGAYQAEVIDKVGGIVGGHDLRREEGLGVEHFEKALKLFPESAIARIEYANGLILLFGKSRIAEADEALRGGGGSASRPTRWSASTSSSRSRELE